MTTYLYNHSKYIVYLLTILILGACETEVDFDTGFTQPKTVVDAWVTLEAEDQIIRITGSQDYLDQERSNGLNAASVQIINLTEQQADPGKGVYDFVGIGNGEYVWPSIGTNSLGKIGDEFQLEILINQKKLVANTKANRVPKIDRIKINLTEDFEKYVGDDVEELKGELFAKDFEGIGDTYWLRTYKNDILLNRPQELTLIYDSQFAAGSTLDGVDFIRTVREGINQQPFDVFPENVRTSWYIKGDKIKAELWSISNEAFDFLTIAKEQMTNGDRSIFAVPVANAKGNIFEENTDNNVIGMFNVAGVSTFTKVVDGPE